MDEIVPKNCTKKKRVKHGHGGNSSQGIWPTPEYNAWRGMRDRCYCPTNHKYKLYGARGIKVCERWRESFLNFFNDIGPKPSPAHSLERANVNGDYEPSNCSWQLQIVQQNNRRDNVIIEYNGKSQTKAQWARELGVPYSVLANRFRKNWSVADAFTRPLKNDWRRKPL